MLYQQFTSDLGPAGLSCRIERPAEPGSPRLFWDGVHAKWVEDPAARVPVVADPTLPHNYLLQIPTAQTRDWPEVTYWVALIGPDGLIDMWPRPVVGGNDGSSPLPSVELPLPGGGSVHLWGAYLKPAPAVVPPVPPPAAG